MKKRKQLFAALTILMFSALSCNKQEMQDLSLKQAIDQSATELNKAMDDITSSKAYGLFTLKDVATKSGLEDQYKVYIPLELVKGVYNYSPAVTNDRWGISLIRYFKKSADNNLMIVNMPLKKVEHPWSLRKYSESDADLANNFSISVSDYYNNYNSYHDFDYLLKSEISIDGVSAGKLNIKSFINPELGKKYESQYAFTDGYTASYAFESGDSTVYSFKIADREKDLYSEERITVKNNTIPFSREHYYILTIGDVKIVRKWGNKSIEIYVNNNLQTEAKVEIVDNEEDSEPSVCKKRDIQITFDDGTTTTLSSLINGSVDDIKTLFSSLHDVYFAAFIVDWIAYDIYYQRN